MMTQSVAATTQSQPEAIYLKDYRAPDYSISHTTLEFVIGEESTLVRSTLEVSRRPEGRAGAPLLLNGELMELLGVTLDGKLLTEAEYQLSEEALELKNLPEQFVLEIETRIDPKNNTALTGLYASRGTYCTQCESEGFRRITYYLDHPDSLSRFTTTIIADKKQYPYLLANGNCVKTADLSDGKHSATWEDPFFKPCYLFALVAGDFALTEDSFTTCSGREVKLQIFVEKGNEHQTAHAMRSLQKSMKWDEEVYGREYDLDIFMIVAVDDFNFGAMENKGLNVFNSQYILANPESATDAEFQGVEGVVAHEYFHNWTGNRITCRDWFQLTLKEGLTVFRDQEFTADMNSRPVKRIQDARFMRNEQFIEDAGPNSHPIRPVSYIEINNFYTTTIYQKGSEVIRMIHTLLGPETYRKATDLYFERFDGQAVTTDDFLSVMQEASGLDLTQFKNWYHQAGTPLCQVAMDYDAEKQVVKLEVSQSCRPTPETEKKQPFFFPLTIGLLDAQGNDLELTYKGRTATTQILHVTQEKETFVFEGVSERPTPSLLRNFSAPVKVTYPYTTDDLVFLLSNDSDAFNRYDAGQRLATEALLGMVSSKDSAVDNRVLEAFAKVLDDETLDEALRAEALTLPSVAALVEEMDLCDFEGAFQARERLTKELAETHEERFVHWYAAMKETDPADLSAAAMGRRRLKNVCLGYLAAVGDNKHLALLDEQFHQGGNMTEQISALLLLCNTESKEKEKALEAYLKRWENDPLVMNKWFIAQSTSKLPSTLDAVKALEKHPAYDAKNPNKLRAVVGAFTRNLPRFHDASGSGYRYITDRLLEIDEFNSHVSGRLATAFRKYEKLPSHLKGLMKAELERILAKEGISKDVYEIISKTLG